MPNSAERSQSIITTIIMMLAIFISIIGFMWVIKTNLETHYPSHKIIKQIQ